MEIKAQKLNALHARHPEAVANPSSVLEVFDEIVEYGYAGGLLQFLKEGREVWKLRKKDITLGEAREAYIADCINEEKFDMVRNLRRLQLPWEDKKISEFAEVADTKAFVTQINAFLDGQITFYNGKPWARATRIGWLSCFLSLINFAVKNKLTAIRENPLSGMFNLAPDPGLGPDTFEMDDLQLFLTYLRHWYPKLYCSFVLATWTCIRLAEVGRMTWEMIHFGIPGKGRIDLDSGITKKEDHRIIKEKHVPHGFELLRQASKLVGKGTELIAVPDWSAKVESAFREFFGRPWPHNAPRSTGVSVLVFRKGMKKCSKIMGHYVQGIDYILINHYLDRMSVDKATRFETMVPLDLTNEVRASFLYRIFDQECDITASTEIWPNYRMTYMPRVNMRHKINEDYLRHKRPIFATAKGSNLVVEIMHRDGREETKTFCCASEDEALILEQKWRIVTLTRLGRLDFETGQVHDYELNFGPCYNQKLSSLERPEQLEELMRRDGRSIMDVAKAIGCATDFVCRCAGLNKRKTPLSRGTTAAAGSAPTGTPRPRRRLCIPERFVVHLKQLFPELVFIPASPSREQAWISRGCVRLPNHHARNARRQAELAAKRAALPDSSHGKNRTTIAIAGH